MLSKFQNKKILLCVSGGIDSIYMYHTLSKEFNQKSFIIGLAHVNYNTSTISKKSMELCKSLSIKHNHPFYLKEVKLDTKSNFENNARTLRYNFFNSIMKTENYDYILTAHNEDDLVETLYMQNTNIDDYSSIPLNQENNFILRPLIAISRSEIQREVNKYDYKYYEDPTNQNLNYKRNFVRYKVLPELEDKDRKIEELINIYNNKIKIYNNFLSSFKNQKMNVISTNSNQIKINRDYLRLIDRYAFKLILQGVIKDEYNQFIKKTAKYWNELYELMKSYKVGIHQKISNNINLDIENDYILISIELAGEVCKRVENNTKWMNFRFNVVPYKKRKDRMDVNTFICPEKMYKNGLYIRKWLYGDKYTISNNKNKNISNLFNEKRIQTTLRSNYPIITYNDRVEWIPGLAHSENNYLESDNLITITLEK